MIRSKVWFVLTIVWLALFAVAAPAMAHGEPEITVTPDTVAAGGKIMVKGDKMGANEEFKVLLEGLKSKVELGEAQSDADQKFELQFTVPTAAPEGTYQVKVEGADGDTVAAELTVTAPAKTAASSDSTNQTPEETMPSAAEHQMTRSRTPGEVGGLFAFAGLAAVAGLVLVLRK